MGWASANIGTTTRLRAIGSSKESLGSPSSSLLTRRGSLLFHDLRTTSSRPERGSAALPAPGTHHRELLVAPGKDDSAMQPKVARHALEEGVGNLVRTRRELELGRHVVSSSKSFFRRRSSLSLIAENTESRERATRTR